MNLDLRSVPKQLTAALGTDTTKHTDALRGIRRFGPEHFEHLECLIAERDQLLEALKFITADVCERFDLDSASTNPGMKLAVKLARAAIAKATGAA